MNNPEGDRSGEPEAVPRAIVAGHAAFSEGLVSAVQQIAGAGGIFLPLSNSGLGGEDIEAAFLSAATQHRISVFFTDLPGGSATLAVRRMMRTDGSIVLVTGANLATLLEFAFHADEEPGEAARRAAEKGRASLVAHGGA
ncbi:MAG: PTS sugar transporter subunit IIA [Gemmatimonadaceae bacterium]